jgi:hypothetical protein
MLKSSVRRLENTRSADGQVRFLVYTLELASGLADREGAHDRRSTHSFCSSLLEPC